jgi:hypothetical protein
MPDIDSCLPALLYNMGHNIICILKVCIFWFLMPFDILTFVLGRSLDWVIVSSFQHINTVAVFKTKFTMSALFKIILGFVSSAGPLLGCQWLFLWITGRSSVFVLLCCGIVVWALTYLGYVWLKGGEIPREIDGPGNGEGDEASEETEESEDFTEITLPRYQKFETHQRDDDD